MINSYKGIDSQGKIHDACTAQGLLHASWFDVKFNTKIKYYPDGGYTIYAASRPIFGPEGWEAAEHWGPLGEAKLEPKGPEPEAEAVQAEPDQAEAKGDTMRARRRARTNVRDLARCNGFSYFVTLTLDASKVDRYDIKAITKKLNTWLDNRVRRNGLKYILIPEYHKDRAIHFHGFFNDAVPADDSGTIIPPGGGKPRKPRSKRQRAEWLEGGGHIVYNLPAWDYGFTSAIELYGDYNAAISYVCKYISKSDEKVGGRWYYSGGDLERPVVGYAHTTAAELLEQYPEAYRADMPEAGVVLVIKEVGPDEC